MGICRFKFGRRTKIQGRCGFNIVSETRCATHVMRLCDNKYIRAVSYQESSLDHMGSPPGRKETLLTHSYSSMTNGTGGQSGRSKQRTEVASICPETPRDVSLLFCVDLPSASRWCIQAYVSGELRVWLVWAQPKACNRKLDDGNRTFAIEKMWLEPALTILGAYAPTSTIKKKIGSHGPGIVLEMLHTFFNVSVSITAPELAPEERLKGYTLIFTKWD
ncbi:unnamed protein product [Haemonchus placei]|uniref:Uncharacterized protein n=1 Tax=Haemonchus placei TaxID=6290 RepID=A0A0N4WD99_HAEPC|nr:unnamed protein product [Haemonchus placei]